MVKPVRNMVLVQKKEVEERTSSGLYVPQNVDEKISTGTVVAVGSGHITAGGAVVPLEVKVGDVVAFNKNMAVELKVEDQTLLCLREDSLYCVL